jgi:hypothetical protein
MIDSLTLRRIFDFQAGQTIPLGNLSIIYNRFQINIWPEKQKLTFLGPCLREMIPFRDEFGDLNW